ncbi:Pterin-4-alpha-carbinolamine dehydratase [Jiangella aurantiaca]|uniref:Putative pterin-4-alpha-carbinolamine dehydratase n=1 Tax=Jiangella aurantiaca TaxID=2530373 RepID=A0A4R5A4J4_9ACTN|nr:VOC family protein [Jiangella aurantiaca]TDD66811.1 Pterin-4-alpha-carbinolamine dehydratase [Jiangella aurantiaca]
MATPITARAFHEDETTQDWRVVGDGACAVFRTGSFADGARLAQALAAAVPDAGPHHPDVDLQRDTVTVRLITVTDHYTGLTDRDLDLARRISAVAREQGLAAEPALVQTVQLTIDALVSADVMPFWAAVLGYERRADNPDEDLVDPRWRGASIWFQDMDAPRPQRNRIHVDVWVPPELAEERVAAALAAGGTLIRDKSPTWWTLADAEGNEVDVATVAGRD